MANSNVLADRLREVFLNGMWIANTNYKDQLISLDWQVAITELHSFNTIAALAQHIHYYVAGVKNVFANGRLEISDIYSFDFPEIKSQQDWDRFLNRFWQDCEDLALYVERLTDEELKKDFVDPKYGDFYRNIDAIIEHSYYHLGQIVLIKKALID
ncbi:DUF1572 domain-containing protein [Nonlabens ulvanivorans]|uniref:DUF1572 domain-containing protein n=1 Tax=Nonlabens ulvanivorans TaxID=906888 RepID=UPI002942F025|nr:DUF1572 domain-containing protein [Nonlabens ulvanivorans]WOI22787.1 DUF1572 domain-containing protein [Nonlabens ulvanivorans]